MATSRVYVDAGGKEDEEEEGGEWATVLTRMRDEI